MTPEERAAQAIERMPLAAVIYRTQIEAVVAAAIREAVAASEERARRTGRELAECRLERDRLQFRASTHEDTIAGLAPLADWARQQLEPERDMLVKIEHPEKMNHREQGYVIGHISANFWEWDEKYVNMLLTDKGRERLAYLRGLVGEEKES